MPDEENTTIIKRNNMPKWAKVMISIPSVVIDGLLVVLAAILSALALGFTNDDAHKHIDGTWLFWLKVGVGAMLQGTIGLSSFRNKIFAEHSKNKQEKEAASPTPTT